jgi:homogentisate 1,2-dioxygenase
VPIYHRQGTVPAKHFTVLTRPSGERYYEELLSSGGFNGPSSLLYRLRNSTRVDSADAMQSQSRERWDDGPIRNHRVDVDLVKGAGEEYAARTALFFNEDLVYSISKPTEAGERFYRNGFHDELLLVVEGTGVFESIFGELEYSDLDFIYVPRGTTWRLRPDAIEHTIVVLETRSHVGPPDRYRNSSGQFLARSLYSERDIRQPVSREPVDESGSFEVVVRADDRMGLYTMDSHPFDVVGWDGALYPYALNMAVVEPLSGRVSLMPDMHQVFASEGVAISAIVPGRAPDHPDAYPGIIDHNADCDEIFHRLRSDGPKHPDIGKVTLHTRASQHGPKPGLEPSAPGLATSLYGLIIDTLRPMHIDVAARDADDGNYLSAWKR